jgi:hypothetical protein
MDDMGENPMKSKQPTTSKTKRQSPAPRTKPGAHTPSVSATLHERIAARAFENYERRIRQGPLDDWLQAEQEILEQKNTRHAEMPLRGGYASEEQGSPIITQATSDTIKEQIAARQTTQIPPFAPLSSCS